MRFSDPPWNEETQQWQELDQQLAEDHPAGAVVAAMKMLDLAPLFASYLAGGTSPIRPDLMLRIVLIEMQQGRHRPSQWFRDTKENIVLMWAGFGIRPSRTSWYNFAQRIGPLIDAFNATVVQRAIELGITQAERAALDGSAVAANASRHRLVNQGVLEKRLAKLDETCSGDKKQQPPGEVESWMAKTPETRAVQRDRYQRAGERLQQLHEINNRQNPCKRRKKEKIVVSTCDPEAALGRDKHHVFRPLYNVQLLSDLDSWLILGYEVFAQSTDSGTLDPMLKRAVEMTGVKPGKLLADATYITASNLAIGDQAGVTLYGPWQENDYSQKKKSSAQAVKIRKEQFQWLEESQMYRCPQGHLLKWIGKQGRRQADGQVNVMHSYRCSPEYCRVCPRRADCTTNPDRGRSVKRSEHEKLVDAHRRRMATEEAKLLYKLRRQTVELGFADLKEHRMLRRFSGRGKQHARTQVGLVVLVRNLLIASRGPPATKDASRETLTPVKTAT